MLKSAPVHTQESKMKFANSFLWTNLVGYLIATFVLLYMAYGPQNHHGDYCFNVLGFDIDDMEYYIDEWCVPAGTVTLLMCGTTCCYIAVIYYLHRCLVSYAEEHHSVVFV